MMQVKKNWFFYIFLRKIGSYGFPETNLEPKVVESCLPCTKINSSILTLQNIHAKTLKRLFSFLGQIPIGDNTWIPDLLIHSGIQEAVFQSESLKNESVAT